MPTPWLFIALFAVEAIVYVSAVEGMISTVDLSRMPNKLFCCSGFLFFNFPRWMDICRLVEWVFEPFPSKWISFFFFFFFFFFFLLQLLFPSRYGGENHFKWRKFDSYRWCQWYHFLSGLHYAAYDFSYLYSSCYRSFFFVVVLVIVVQISDWTLLATQSFPRRRLKACPWVTLPLSPY